VVQIDILPDDVLLEIFDFYVDTMSQWSYAGERVRIEAWQSLVHVCRRWRSLVLGSPRRLNLHLFCTSKTPVKDTLDVWPPLPLIVGGDMDLSRTDNIIAALGQSNRVCKVDLFLAGWQLENILAAMQVPFPELTDLRFYISGESLPVIPYSFLGGSAPRLQYFELSRIIFPGLPNLLSSANNLAHLNLFRINSYYGYISPETMVAVISVLSSLEELSIAFQSFQSRPDRKSPSVPPPKRFILPALEKFCFKGVIEYLEDLVTFIDAPQLNYLVITIYYEIDFDCSRLARFINCTPGYGACDEAYVRFDGVIASVKLRYRTPKTADGFFDLQINIRAREPDFEQLSAFERVCNFSLHLLSAVEDLYVEWDCSRRFCKDDLTENALWLQFLLPFTVVKNLYLCKQFAPGIAAALQELVGARITEVLPSLQNIFVEELEPLGPFLENIGQFVAARQLSGHPTAISVWDKHSHM
jgi:hypothetical protein